MKLWQKNTASLKEVETFTVGHDREMDLYLAAFDVLGSLAHTRMLESIGLLTAEETIALHVELKKIYARIQEGKFSLQDNVEDIHSQVELLLTETLGDTGKKIHSARSRNDQVLVDMKLFLRNELELTVKAIEPFFQLLQQQSEKYKAQLLPGYTHLQLAMPSSFGLWFGAYAESLVDDVITLKAAYDVVNKNPLGSAAGYGSSFPINRTLTTQLLGFADLNYNVVYAQMGRGKAERVVAQSLANVADTLARLSMDACLYLNQNFSFISFPPELTTGSSIMPHKKNPDVFELIRSHCNRIKALPNEIMLMTTNLPSGYHRDLQLLKEHLFPAFRNLRDCLEMAGLMLSNIDVKDNILTDEKYKYLFSVEEVNKRVLAGMPFRDAYKEVGLDIEAGKFTYDLQLNHTHEGSIGQLCTAEIRKQMDNAVAAFPFAHVQAAIDKLLS
ncbi:MAG: argininosuccinate lyase [Sphingobacteriales bacterium SCN 48-20]|uniref:argininosuccinate lyase n=1 Tax=Terrimonas ferruginea TaxID=249 RepID=UPI00086D1CB2|nr:argininosuccinate lyase [Terrimonas ferruginea]MBN8781443.1 argininosuccinate lyase [Terrimonas ferruginea]ODT92428.1 MAG: argininosuccinate lyase [Sphingobacteriales bacterium SCN 48-20]OJW44608.1 MAG: argininosuccinate lyase [Sphingobacteriales bacterium 48-107]